MDIVGELTVMVYRPDSVDDRVGGGTPLSLALQCY